MKFYQVNTGDKTEYAGTMDGVKTIVKAIDAVYRSAITVAELDVATDKDSLLALLNNGGTRPDGTSVFGRPVHTWTVTPRGSLAPKNITRASNHGVL